LVEQPKKPLQTISLKTVNNSKGKVNLETIFNVIPSGNYLIIEAWNKHCKIRVAEKNNKVIYRLIKTALKLYLKTIKTFYSLYLVRRGLG